MASFSENLTQLASELNAALAHIRSKAPTPSTSRQPNPMKAAPLPTTVGQHAANNFLALTTVQQNVAAAPRPSITYVTQQLTQVNSVIQQVIANSGGTTYQSPTPVVKPPPATLPSVNPVSVVTGVISPKPTPAQPIGTTGATGGTGAPGGGLVAE